MPNKKGRETKTGKVSTLLAQGAKNEPIKKPEDESKMVAVKIEEESSSVEFGPGIICLTHGEHNSYLSEEDYGSSKSKSSPRPVSEDNSSSYLSVEDKSSSYSDPEDSSFSGKDNDSSSSSSGVYVPVTPRRDRSPVRNPPPIGKKKQKSGGSKELKDYTDKKKNMESMAEKIIKGNTNVHNEYSVLGKILAQKIASEIKKEINKIDVERKKKGLYIPRKLF